MEREKQTNHNSFFINLNMKDNSKLYEHLMKFTVSRFEK